MEKSFNTGYLDYKLHPHYSQGSQNSCGNWLRKKLRMVWEDATQILDNSDNVMVYEPFQREKLQNSDIILKKYLRGWRDGSSIKSRGSRFGVKIHVVWF